MAPSPSSSHSDGEILEADLEKATTSLVVPKDTSVDRPSRKCASISRSPSPYRLPRWSNSRSGSRSPYRESRGSKRSIEDDHYEPRGHDPRRFKVRYEDQATGDRVTQNLFQRGLDRRSNVIDQRQSYDDRGANGRSRDRRHRRSRSPGSFRGHLKNRSINSPNGLMDSQSWQKHNDHGYGESKSKLSKQQSVSDRSQTSVATTHSRHDAETMYNQTQQDRSSDAKSHRDPANNTETSTGVSEEANNAASEDPVDEATLIEERRKRREAIKAKHKGWVTPLSVQVLAIDKSAPSTPEVAIADKEVPVQVFPHVSPLATPMDTLDQDLPTDFSIAKDSGLVNSGIVIDDITPADEPSAADYDPRMDMQEDKLRQYQQQDTIEVSASTHDENANADQGVLIPDVLIEVPGVPQASDAFDMFGDDEELDMFAKAPVAVPKARRDATKAVLIPRGKAVDMSMLDDCDDPDGYYKVILGELLDSRYLVQSNLGKGMFSGVVRATDQKTNTLVAIKLARNNEAMRKTGFKEIGILEKLMASDPEDKKHVIRLERYFEHKGHLCMVFENLSIDLREVLKKFGRDIGINLKAVREYARQMFLGLSLLRKCNILHADIKPDNILVNEARSNLKICDLGSASDASENEITQYLVSRFYRAPEIILGLPYDFAIDMWSVGCTLFELYTGKILFTGRSNNQMLRAIMECRGKFSHKLLRKGEFAGLHFDDLLNFRSSEKDRISGKDSIRILNFAKPTRDLKTRLMANVRGVGEAEVKELNLFVDLLDRCLNLNPEKRCTPNEALKHPFIMRPAK